jgi:hypothetical protein
MAGLTLHALGRSGLVLGGLLLLGVGLGDVVAGHRKIAQYEELVRATAPSAPADPAALFPTATEGQERQELARTKLAFYQLLLSGGQLLTALGFTLAAFGVLRVRTQSVRADPDTPAAN